MEKDEAGNYMVNGIYVSVIVNTFFHRCKNCEHYFRNAHGGSLHYCALSREHFYQRVRKYNRSQGFFKNYFLKMQDYFLDRGKLYYNCKHFKTTILIYHCQCGHTVDMREVLSYGVNRNGYYCVKCNTRLPDETVKAHLNMIRKEVESWNDED